MIQTCLWYISVLLDNCCCLEHYLNASEVMDEETCGAGNLSGVGQPITAAPNRTVCDMSNQTSSAELFNAANDHSFGKIYIFTTTSLFGTILLTSLVGNSLVTSTIIRRKKMRTPCNYFIMNIALGDIGVGAIAAPLRILEMYLSWPLGKFICHFLWPIQDVFVCVSVMTHTTIALERHRAIVVPFRPKISLRKTKIAIVVIWLVSYCASGIPQSFLLEVIEVMGWKHCAIQWPSSLFRLCYIFYLVLLFILTPLIVQTWCYVRVARVLNRKREFCQSMRILSRKGSDERKAQQQRMVRMLLICLAVFQVCYIPRGILLLVLEFYSPQMTFNQAFAYVDLISLVLYYCKHIVNPVILFSMSADFRKALMASLKCNYTGQKDSLFSHQQYTNQHSSQEATV